MISEQEAKEAAARIVAYETGTPLSRVYLHAIDPIEAANNDAWDLARLYMREIARREAERAERAKPIDAEWLLSLGECIRDDKDAFGVRLSPTATAIMERPNVALSLLQKQPSTIVHGRIRDQKLSVVVATRGQLLDLLAALRGTERPA